VPQLTELRVIPKELIRDEQRLVTAIVSTGLKAPVGVAVDSMQNVHVADTNNNAAVTQSGDVPATIVMAAGYGQNTPEVHAISTALEARVKREP